MSEFASTSPRGQTCRDTNIILSNYRHHLLLPHPLRHRAAQHAKNEKKLRKSQQTEKPVGKMVECHPDSEIIVCRYDRLVCVFVCLFVISRTQRLAMGTH